MTRTGEAALEFLLTLPESDRVTVADFLHESVHRSKSHDGAAISAKAAIATMLARHPTLFSHADKQKMQSVIDLAAGS